MPGFDDFFDLAEEDFIIDPDDYHSRDDNESWDTGIEPDIFSTGQAQDIFTTKDVSLDD